MTEKLHTTTPEAGAESTERPGFLGALSLMRHKLGAYTPGQRLDKALEEIKATKPTLGDVAEGVETDLNHAAAVHAEHAGSDPDVLDFEWDVDFPDKSVGYIDPQDPTSTYHGRDD